MKKLIFVLTLLLSVFALHAQVGSIVDGGTFIQVAFSNGDTTSIEKDQIVKLIPDGNKLTFVPPNDKTSFATVLTYSDFGYSNIHEFRREMDVICFNRYDEVYVYTTGVLDTIHYQFEGTTKYSINLDYTGSDLTFKETITY